MGRPPGGLTAGRGRGVLGLGGLRACEGVRGRARACFTLTQFSTGFYIIEWLLLVFFSSSMNQCLQNHCVWWIFLYKYTIVSSIHESMKLLFNNYLGTYLLL